MGLGFAAHTAHTVPGVYVMHFPSVAGQATLAADIVKLIAAVAVHD